MSSRVLRYRQDVAYRRRQLNTQARYEGRPQRYLLPITTITGAELCDLLGISDSTLDKYVRLGLIPAQTYPSRFRVYWLHQAKLIGELFKHMREEGWPRVTPHFVGSPFWDAFFKKMEANWSKEKSDG